jgi:predicted HAD superfamily Cof-like phosphohydrolase
MKKLTGLFVQVNTDKDGGTLAADVRDAVREMQAKDSDGDGSDPVVLMEGQLIPSIEYQDVKAFHEKFGVSMAKVASLLGQEAYDFRLKFMREELQEFQDDHEGGDLHGAADALVDLVYVAVGTALIMGLPWDTLWREVQRKNMEKMRATKKDESKRGSKFDVVKPAGWTPPDHTNALMDGYPLNFQGWQVFDPSSED